MRSCLYCGATANLNKEHCISECVNETLYPTGNECRPQNINDGNPIVVRKPGGFQFLVRNVCQPCNERLSEKHDPAGKLLAIEIMKPRSGQTFRIPFTNFTLAWLVKTHVNLICCEGRGRYPIDRRILDGILSADLSPDLFCLCLSSYFGPMDRGTDYGFSDSSLNERDGNILLNTMRLRYLDTAIMIPMNGNYDGFAERVNAILTEFEGNLKACDVDGVLERGYLQFV